MWDFKDGLRCILSGLSGFIHLTDGFAILNKSGVEDIMDTFQRKGSMDMSLGMKDILRGIVMSYWVGIFLSVLSTVEVMLLTGFGSFISKFIFSTVLGSVAIAGIINIFIIMCMKNHEHSWGNIWVKIMLIITVINLVSCGISCVSSIFQIFSISGIGTLIANAARFLCYGIVLKGLVVGQEQF